jgi:hypothetical protein
VTRSEFASLFTPAALLEQIVESRSRRVMDLFSAEEGGEWILIQRLPGTDIRVTSSLIAGDQVALLDHAANVIEAVVKRDQGDLQ